MLKIKWDEKVCIHSGNCVKTLPSVFQVKDRKFVIIPDGAPEDQIRKTVKACPSGALRIEE
ncbi:MAG: (4Fe-4S)-binding protein [Nitrososphaerales archaeon]